jgi:hypothetical protein
MPQRWRHPIGPALLVAVLASPQGVWAVEPFGFPVQAPTDTRELDRRQVPSERVATSPPALMLPPPAPPPVAAGPGTGYGQPSPVSTVTAEGVGVDIASASQNAAQNALTNVVGSFMDASKVMEKQSAITDGIRSQTTQIRTDIKEYSQGSIQGFEILSATNQGALVRVSAKVTVRIEDFKTFVKKLAEGETAVPVGLFAQAETASKQAQNLAEIMRGILLPIENGEVVHFEVGQPRLLSAVDAMERPSKYDMQFDRLLRENGESQIVMLKIRAVLDPNFLESLKKTLNSSALRHFSLPRGVLANWNIFPGGRGVRRDADAVYDFSLEFGKPGSFTLITRLFPQDAMAQSVDAYIFQSREALTLLPWLEQGHCNAFGARKIPDIHLDVLDSSGASVQSIASRDGGFLVFPFPFASGGQPVRADTLSPAWSLLPCAGRPIDSAAPPVILGDRTFAIFFAATPETLKSAAKIVLKMN